jgi:hypothetical protein
VSGGDGSVNYGEKKAVCSDCSPLPSSKHGVAWSDFGDGGADSPLPSLEYCQQMNDDSPLPSWKYRCGGGTVSVVLGTVTAYDVLTVDFD